MGKKIVDETLKFSIVINGNEAQKEYGKLERSNRSLKNSNKDLEDQAKKLAKANKQNSDEYKKLQSDIKANSKVIDANKQKMSGLTKEIGINNLTTRQLRKEAGRLQGVLNNLDPNTEQWKNYNKQLQAVRGRQANLRDEMKATSMSMEDQESALGLLVVGFSQFTDGIKSGNYQEASQGLRTITGGIKSATKAAIAFIATPLGAAIAVIAGIGFAVKQWFDYNSTIQESIILTEQITRLQGEQADAIRLRNKALSETFALDEKENLEVARNLVEQFGISYNEAFNVIEDGLIKGQKNNKEYFESLREYPTFFAQAGYSAQEFKDIISTGYDLGIYNDKLPDAIKEFDISIREQTKSTREALLNAFGAPFTDDLLQRVKNGSTTTKEALIEVSTEAQKQGLNLQQNAQLTADLFRGAGEDVGGAVKILEAVDVAAKNATRALTPLEESTKQLSKANRELASAQDEALKSDNYVSFTRELSIFWTKTKTLFYNGISFIVDTFTNVSDYVVTTISSIVITAQSLPSILTKGLKDVATNVLNTIKTLGGLGDVIGNLLDFNFDGAKESYAKFKADFDTNFNSIKQSAKDTVVEIIKTQETAKQIAQAQIDTNRAGNVASVNQEASGITVNNDGSNTNNVETDEATKAEEDKAVADALRKKQRVQDAIDQFNEEQAILDKLKEVEKEERKEEEEILKEEAKFEKLITDAEGETELLSQLEDQKLVALQNIRDKYVEERLQKDEEDKKKLAANEEKFKKQLTDAETKFQQAKSRAILTGLGIIRSAFGEQTALGKIMLAFEKAAAIASIVKTTTMAVASAKAANAAVPWVLPPGVPNPAKPLSIASTAKSVLTAKINMATSIASIVGTAIKGFESGLYPVTRAQDGKVYQSSFSGDASTQIVGSPTTFLAGEMPEMIIDPSTFKKMDPRVTDYILALAGKPTQGFETGLYKQSTPTPNISEDVIETPDAINNDVEIQTLEVLSNLSNQLASGIIAKVMYGLEDEEKRQELEDKLNATINASKN